MEVRDTVSVSGRNLLRWRRDAHDRGAESSKTQQGAQSRPELAPHSVGVADLRGLAAALEARIGLPVSGEAVTAYLESQGWSDADAKTRFGCADLAALGTRAWEQSWTMLAPDSAQRLAAPAGQAVDAATTPLQGVFFWPSP